MTVEDKERIEKEAVDYSTRIKPLSIRMHHEHGYIAGATAEHKRLQGQLNYANNNIHALTESRNNLAESAQQELQAYRDKLKAAISKRMGEVDPAFALAYYDITQLIDTVK